MQSSGGIMDVKRVVDKPAAVVESGPAAGVIGAASLGAGAGYENLITFDMGGTTAKAALIEGGRVVVSDEYEVGGGISLSSRLAKGGGYANSISYTHSSTLRTFQEIFNVSPLLGDAANADDLSDLFNFNVGQLSVTPAAKFSSSGTVGGPFNPISQGYTLANSGSATLSWTATNSANWLTLSASSGTLPPGSNATITASLNANANSLSAGSYSDAVSFLNTNTGTGNTTRGATLTVNNPAPPFIGFSDDFSTFAPGNLVGQSNWTQLGTATGLPLQVSGGQVTIHQDKRWTSRTLTRILL